MPSADTLDACHRAENEDNGRCLLLRGKVDRDR